jgi:hypothetical protein
VVNGPDRAVPVALTRHDRFPTLDHHLVIAGQSETFGNGRMDVWLLKIDDATLPTGVEGEESGAGRDTSPDPVAPIVLLGAGSPNPFAIATTIRYRVHGRQTAKLVLTR